MPAMNWRWVGKADPEAEYLALISYLPLKRFWMVPKFLVFTREVQQQLAGSRGLVGYSLLARHSFGEILDFIGLGR